VAVRLVQLDPNLAGKFDIEGVPHVLVYDSSGKLLAGDQGRQKAGQELLYKWMNLELKKHLEGAGQEK
ncbi:MAG TPA: hypothetical protein VM098_07365, partial [Phycisphaerae bacterium]|nr:hypothetical protein [Phycisphaerae bacterium]